MEPRRADVPILYNGVNAAVQLAPCLSSFQYVDVASGSSDKISIQINDRDHRWIGAWFPQKGDLLQPTIQTLNWRGDGQNSRFQCGTFRVDDFSFAGQIYFIFYFFMVCGCQPFRKSDFHRIAFIVRNKRNGCYFS